MKSERAIKQLRELEKLGSAKEMRLAAEEWDADWKILISTIMSAQSRDETTIPIAEKLFEKYKDVEKLSNANYSDVLKIFQGLNYNKTKAGNVINCAKELVEKHDGKVPHNFNKLIELPGVGRKTANVFLSEKGHDEIGVDTHVFYISSKLGWSNAKNRDKTEIDLRKLFPQKLWGKINPTLVRFGKSYTSRKEKDKLLDKIRGIK